MKICFTGAHSTGKTTLLNYFVEKHRIKDSLYITEVARKIIKRGFGLGTEATMDSYFNYINDQLFEEQIGATMEFVISDRSLIDTVGYAKSNLEYGYSKVDNYVVEALERIWKLEKNYFDFYVYFPIEFEIVNDGFRDLKSDYQKRVGEIIKELLINTNISFITVTGSIEERYKQFIEELSIRKVIL